MGRIGRASKVGIGAIGTGRDAAAFVVELHSKTDPVVLLLPVNFLDLSLPRFGHEITVRIRCFSDSTRRSRDHGASTARTTEGVHRIVAGRSHRGGAGRHWRIGGVPCKDVPWSKIGRGRNRVSWSSRWSRCRALGRRGRGRVIDFSYTRTCNISLRLLTNEWNALSRDYAIHGKCEYKDPKQLFLHVPITPAHRQTAKHQYISLGETYHWNPAEPTPTSLNAHDGDVGAAVLPWCPWPELELGSLPCPCWHWLQPSP